MMLTHRKQSLIVSAKVICAASGEHFGGLAGCHHPRQGKCALNFGYPLTGEALGSFR